MPLRPFAVSGFFAFAAALSAAYFGPRMAGVSALACGVLGFCALSFGLWNLLQEKKAGQSAPQGLNVRAKAAVSSCVIALLTAGLIFGLYSIRWYQAAAPVQNLDGVQAQVRMEILDYPQARYNRYYYQARVLKIDGQRVEPFRIRLSCTEAFYCNPYDIAEAELQFYRFSSNGLYSAYNGQLADGNVLGAFCSGYEVSTVPRTDYPVESTLPAIRSLLERAVSSYLPRQEAGLIQALLTGNRSNLTPAAYDHFSRIGCSHMLAVSGLHMSVLAAFFSLILSRLPLARPVRNMVCAIPLFFYLVLTGFPPSAIRSYIMFFLYLLAGSLGQRPDSLNSLGAAVLVICLTNPFSGGDLGFCLSVLSTAGIVTISRPLQQTLSRPLCRFPRFRRFLRPVTSAVSVTLSAVLFSLPVQLSVYGGFPLLSLLANLLMLPLLTALLLCSLPFLMAASIRLPSAAVQPLALCCGVLARLELWTAEKLASIPWAYITLKDATWLLVLGLCLSEIAFFLQKPAPKREQFLSALGAILLITGTGTILHEYQWHGGITLAISADESSACVIAMRDGQASVLTLGGSDSDAASEMLARRNIFSLNTVFVPQWNWQAREMARELLSSSAPERLLLFSDQYVAQELRRFQTPLQFLDRKDQIISLLPGIQAAVSQEGGQLTLVLNGKTVILDLNGQSSGTCDFLITHQPDVPVQSKITFLLLQDWPQPEELKSSAQYQLIQKNTPVYLDFFSDGRVEIASFPLDR